MTARTSAWVNVDTYMDRTMSNQVSYPSYLTRNEDLLFGDLASHPSYAGRVDLQPHSLRSSLCSDNSKTLDPQEPSALPVSAQQGGSATLLPHRWFLHCTYLLVLLYCNHHKVSGELSATFMCSWGHSGGDKILSRSRIELC